MVHENYFLAHNSQESMHPQGNALYEMASQKVVYDQGTASLGLYATARRKASQAEYAAAGDQEDPTYMSNNYDAGTRGWRDYDAGGSDSTAYGAASANKNGPTYGLGGARSGDSSRHQPASRESARYQMASPDVVYDQGTTSLAPYATVRRKASQPLYAAADAGDGDSTAYGAASANKDGPTYDLGGAQLGGSPNDYDAGARGKPNYETSRGSRASYDTAKNRETDGDHVVASDMSSSGGALHKRAAGLQASYDTTKRESGPNYDCSGPQARQARQAPDEAYDIADHDETYASAANVHGAGQQMYDLSGGMAAHTSALHGTANSRGSAAYDLSGSQARQAPGEVYDIANHAETSSELSGGVVMHTRGSHVRQAPAAISKRKSSLTSQQVYELSSMHTRASYNLAYELTQNTDAPAWHAPGALYSVANSPDNGATYSDRAAAGMCYEPPTYLEPTPLDAQRPAAIMSQDGYLRPASDSGEDIYARPHNMLSNV